MYVSVLSSGSKGNATLLDIGGMKFLIDAGISACRIQRALAEQGVSLSDISGIFLTHEHSDHVKGLETLMKKQAMPIYGSEPTLREIAENMDLPKGCFEPIRSSFSVGSVSVFPFGVPHDAARPLGYRFVGDATFAYATDLGFVTQVVAEYIDGADMLVIEANHNIAMLRGGRYPIHLKRRILSSSGHLSNTDAAWAIARMKKLPEEVILAHLSEENNTAQVALSDVEKVLSLHGISLNIQVALPDSAVCAKYADDVKMEVV